MRLSDFFPLLEEDDDEDEEDEESGVARAKRGPRVPARSQQKRVFQRARDVLCVRVCDKVKSGGKF